MWLRTCWSFSRGWGGGESLRYLCVVCVPAAQRHLCARVVFLLLLSLS